jgi:hypothetical protein
MLIHCSLDRDKLGELHRQPSKHPHEVIFLKLEHTQAIKDICDTIYGIPASCNKERTGCAFNDINLLHFLILCITQTAKEIE